MDQVPQPGRGRSRTAVDETGKSEAKKAKLDSESSAVQSWTLVGSSEWAMRVRKSTKDNIKPKDVIVSLAATAQLGLQEIMQPRVTASKINKPASVALSQTNAPADVAIPRTVTPAHIAVPQTITTVHVMASAPQSIIPVRSMVQTPAVSAQVPIPYTLNPVMPGTTSAAAPALSAPVTKPKTIVQVFVLDVLGMSCHFQSGSRGRKRLDEIERRHEASVIQGPQLIFHSANSASASQPSTSANTASAIQLSTSANTASVNQPSTSANTASASQPSTLSNTASASQPSTSANAYFVSQPSTSTSIRTKLPLNQTVIPVNDNVIKFSNGLTVTIFKGSLVDEQVDVLINVTRAGLNLDCGGVSSLLLQAAGPGLPLELTQKAPDGLLTPGEIIVTSAHNLKSRQLYHSYITKWDSDAGICEQYIRQLVRNALSQAASAGHTSIAFPALGTGKMKVPPNFSAKWMLSEVESFNPSRASTSLQEIRFVLFPIDLPVVNAFTAEIKGILQKLNSLPVLIKAVLTRPVDNDAAVKNRRLVNPSKDCATTTWMTKCLPSTPGHRKWSIPVNSVTLEIYQGDLTSESVDAIVNSTNKHFSGGILSAAIDVAAGPELQKECDKMKGVFPSQGPFMTPGYNMKCKQIIHMHNPGSETESKREIEKVLELVHDKNLESVAFPLIGTGAQHQSVAQMASNMLDAITSFTSQLSALSKLKLIRIVIFDSPMVGQFAVALDKKADDSPLKIVNSLSSPGLSTCPRKGNARYEDRNVFIVEGKSQKSVMSAISDIKDYSKDIYTEKVLESDLYRATIAQLSLEQVSRIQSLEKDYLVKVVVEKGLRSKIVISGETEVVSCVQEKIFEIFHSMKRAELQKIESKTHDSQAQWMFEDERMDYNYPEEIGAIIERAYQNNTPAVYWTENNGGYSINFNDMLEFKIESADVARNVKRAAKELQFPGSWEPMFASETLRVVQLKKSSIEYETVAQNIKLKDGQMIIKVERIQNPTLYKQYLVRKRHMEGKSLAGTGVERRLWHGCSSDTVQNINRTGFNRSYCGKNATSFGRGVYFASNFRYSAKDKYSVPSSTDGGQKTVYQCLVLTGEYALGDQSYIEPPLCLNSLGSHYRYDSVVNDLLIPSIFVIFSDTQAYPEYLVTIE